MLLGRGAQRRAIEAALARAVAGHGRPVLVTGPRGSGATALLDDVQRSARSSGRGWLVLPARAAPDEADLEHALLHQVLVPLLDELGDELDVAPRASLEAATGVRAAQPDQVPVPMATLTALDRASRRQPVLVVIDDLPWADPASAAALRFLCRRLSRSAVCLVLAAPGGAADGSDVGGDDWSQLAEVVPLTPLADDDALAWVEGTLPGLDPVDGARLVRLAAGRPRRLADLVRLVGATGAARPQLVGAHLPTAVQAREALAACSAGARRALLVRGLLDDDIGAPHAGAVLERLRAVGGGPVGTAPDDPPGDDPPGDDPPGDDPLLEELAVVDAAAPDVVAARTAWSDVLREAAERSRGGSGGVSERLAAESVRQRALAAPHPDAALAAELRASAGALAPVSARRSGDLHELAARAEPDAAARSADLLRSAEVALVCGRETRAAALAEAAGPAGAPGAGPGPAALRAARSRWLAVRALVTGDHVCALRHLQDSLAAAASGGTPAEEVLVTGAALVLLAGRRGPGGAALDSAAAALPEAPAGVLRSVARAGVPWEATTPQEQQQAFTDLLGVLAGSALPVHRWAADLGRLLGRADDAAVACRRRLAAVGPAGAAAVDLRLALSACWLEAASLPGARGEVDAAREALRRAPGLVADVDRADLLVGFLGGEPLAADPEALRPLVADTPERGGVVWVVSHRHRMRGEMGPAASGLLRLWPEPGEPAGAPALLHALPLAHALRETGLDLERLSETVVQVGAWAAGSGSPRAASTDLMCRAVVADGSEEKRLLLERAVRAAAGGSGEAPAQLALGMHLRRSRRGVTSREPLRAALEAFEASGFAVLAELARRELDATAPQRPPRPMGSSALTSQERAVADLAAQRTSNAEIAYSLGISPRTVAHHLQRVYAKLGISGRHQLQGRHEGA